MTVSTPELVVVGLAVAAGSTVQAAIGFGSMLVATVVGAQVLPTEALIPLLLPLSLAQTTIVVGRTRRSVDVRYLAARILPAMGVGIALAALGPGVAAPGMRPVLGIGVTGLGLFELARRGRAPPLSRPAAALVLVGAGAVQAVLGTGGPLVVWAVGREVGEGGRLTPTTFRSTLNALWLVVNTVLLGALVSAGRVDATTLGRTAVLLPGALLGVALGLALHHRVDEARFRRILWAVLALCGVPLLLAR